MKWFTKVVFNNYRNFSGRACRKEFWIYNLSYIIVLLASLAYGCILSPLMETSAELMLSVLGAAYASALAIPSAAVMVRRLHDTGKSAWWLLFLLIPLAGTVCILVLLCIKGSGRANRYGAAQICGEKQKNTYIGEDVYYINAEETDAFGISIN